MFDRFLQLPAGSIQLRGRLGRALRLTVDNRLKKVDYAKLVRSFREHEDGDGVWRGEFWGKIVRSAIRILQTTPDAELEAMIRTTVRDLCSAADPDGCLTTYPPEKRCTYWDVWGRKYALLGLERYYRSVESSPEVLEAIRKQVNALLKDDPFREPPKEGPVWHDGLAAFSILGAIEIAARLTGEKRFYEAAERLVKLGCTFSGTLFKDFRCGKRPADLANGKAYEMTSCFEGLLEMYRDTGDRKYLDVAEAYFRDVCNHELFVTGTGGCRDRWGEYWDNGRFHQTELDTPYAFGETCVTTTLLRFAFQLLRLTGDSRYADYIEYAVYNAALGSMKYDGSWWMHRNPTPLAAPSWKMPAGDQIAGYGEDCCLAQGPEGIGVGGAAAAMRSEEGLVLNFLEDVQIRTTVNGVPVTVAISGNYPAGERLEIAVTAEKPVEFTLALRIPGWCKAPQIEFNGETWTVAQGRYARLTRVWDGSETVKLTLPMPIVKTPAPHGNGAFCMRRGPVLLVQDSRLGGVGAAVTLPDETPERIAVAGFHDVYRWPNGVQLGDYASAGNLFEEKNTICVLLHEKEI